jgi:predicted DNA-binding ribbon-helix-helix protein
MITVACQKKPSFFLAVNLLLTLTWFPPIRQKEVALTISRLVNRNVVAGRGRTSMRLEPELWDALSEICEREALDMSTLVRQVEAAGHIGGRTSAVRVYIQNYFRAAATEIGHAGAGHGPMPRSRVSEMPRSAPDHNPQHQTALADQYDAATA